MTEQNGPQGLRVRPARPVSITVFFPCFNEQANVRRMTEQATTVLEKLQADYEIIIVDDGSADDTGRIADEIAASRRTVRVVHHPQNRGYGAALQSGIRAATKELVFYTDGDGQFDLEELPSLLPLIERYDIVSCYRMNRRDNLVRKFNGWAWTRLVRLVFSLKVRDVDCGFKLYRRAVFDAITLESTGALISTEILARAARKGFTITEKGVHHYPRTAGKPTGANPAVILRAFRELFQLRRRILAEE
jgi:glycosyltransferase involved in cell wall biosynthesis